MVTVAHDDVVCNLVYDGTLELENAELPTEYCGIVVSRDMIMVTDWKGCNVRIHRRQDGKLLVLTDRMEARPFGICLINDTEIGVILDNSNIEILSVQCTGDTGAVTKVKTLHVKPALDGCHGVAKFMDKFVVLGVKEDTICWCIVSLIDGHDVSLHRICKGNLDSYLAAKDNMIYISTPAADFDSSDAGVYAHDIQNPDTHKFMYKHDQLNDPSGLTVDTRGFIFVSNYAPHCIHHLTDRCQIVSIYREGIPSLIWAVCWDSHQGHLYLSSWRRKGITRYKPVYSDEQGYQRPLSEETHTQGTEGMTNKADSETEEEELPPEILRMDTSFQKLYREVLSDGKDELYNIRVMIVGHKGVGKTSLAQRLLGEQVKENSTDSTEGIEVHARCCQIDHATAKWKRKLKTDELFLNDQRIASILRKYTHPQSNQDVKESDPLNDISPRKKQRLSLQDASAVPSPLDGDTGSILDKGTLSQISNNAPHITEGDASSSHAGNSGQYGNGLEEAVGIAYPEEIKNFVERAQSLPVRKSKSSDVTLLDFAGESLFYTTHQAFMSWRTLYLLVTDMSLPLTDVAKDGENRIEVSGTNTSTIQEYVTYWLNSIHSHVLIPEYDTIRREGKKTRKGDGSEVQGGTKNRPFVILVGTHADKIPKDLLDERKKTYFHDIRIALQNSPLLFHLVDEDFAISNLGSDPNINDLKSKIFEIAQKQEYWGEVIPARWIRLERALIEFRNGGIQVMDYADVERVNQTLEVKVERRDELDLFLKFEHDMGNIVFFNTKKLRRKVVLDPEWLILGVRTWITSEQVIKRHPELLTQWTDFKNTGRLTSTLIEKLWSSDSVRNENKEHLLDIMIQMSIIAKPLQMKEEVYYWVPCMVSVNAPDHMKKLQQNKDTTKTSTLCFRSKTNFIHIGVFHRLLATCLSKWEPAKEGDSYLFFRGLCVFNIDEQHQLLLSLNVFVIHATVIRFTKIGRIPDLSLCMIIRDELYTELSEISDCLCPGSELEICIKCKESSPLTNEGLHCVSTLRTKDELRCSTHKEAHCVESKELFGFWEEDKTHIPDTVLPQHSAYETEMFIRLSVLVLNVGSEVLRKVLIYNTNISLCTLDEYVTKNKPIILELQKKKVLTQAQVDVIFPQSGESDIHDYDIAIASVLLNSIYHLQEKQLIKDLHNEQNELAQCASVKMNEQEFKTKWSKIETTLKRLSKLCKDPTFDNKVHQEIQDIQQSDLFTILSKKRAILTEISTIETGIGIDGSVLRKLSKDLISRDWKFFFRELSVPEHELIRVDIDYQGDVQEKIYRLLYRLNLSGSIHKTNIIQALKNTEKNHLVDKYSEVDFSAC